MKRVFAALVIALFVAAGVSASAQSLGDVARQQRAKKPAPSPGGKVYTNDSITSGGTSTSATAGESDSASTSQPAAASTAASGSAAAGSESSGTSAEDRAKLENDWKQKFAEQKKVISGLERELDVLKRENKLRAATYYSDAGNRLRDEKKYAEDDRKYQADIAAKEQELTAAKQKLEDMKDESRRAGLSSRVYED